MRGIGSCLKKILMQVKKNCGKILKFLKTICLKFQFAYIIKNDVMRVLNDKDLMVQIKTDADMYLYEAV